MGILCCSVVLWLGDLNYRISDLDVDDVKDLIAKQDFETLYNHDQVKSLVLSLVLWSSTSDCAMLCVFQLKRQMDEETVFVGFTEGEIDFQPTYKYDTGSDQWDTRYKWNFMTLAWHFYLCIYFLTVNAVLMLQRHAKKSYSWLYWDQSICRQQNFKDPINRQSEHLSA